MPLDTFTEPLNPMGKMIQLKIQASDGHRLFTNLICFTLMQASRWHHVHLPVPTGTPTRFWGPNPKTSDPPVVLRPKLPNYLEERVRYTSSTISTCVAVVLDRPITKSTCASAWLGHCHISLVNMVYSSACTLAHRCHQVSATHGKSFGHLDPSVQISRPSFTTPSPLARHVSTWPFPCSSTVSMIHTYTPTQPRGMLHMHSQNG